MREIILLSKYYKVGTNRLVGSVTPAALLVKRKKNSATTQSSHSKKQTTFWNEPTRRFCNANSAVCEAQEKFCNDTVVAFQKQTTFWNEPTRRFCNASGAAFPKN